MVTTALVRAQQSVYKNVFCFNLQNLCALEKEQLFVLRYCVWQGLSGCEIVKEMKQVY